MNIFSLEIYTSVVALWGLHFNDDSFDNDCIT